MSDTYNIVSLTSDGQNTTILNLSTGLFSLTTKYNYSAQCWMMDLRNADGTDIITGVMLVPNIDLLLPYPAIRESVGTFLIIEQNSGDYMNPDGLGSSIMMLWFSPTDTVEIPA